MYKILTFDIQLGFACQIIALANDASVPAAIGRLGVLDDKGEQVLVLCHGVFFAFVAFLRGRKISRPLVEAFFVRERKCQAAFAFTALVHFL